MNEFHVFNENNLTVLDQLVESNQKFDLIELDGPYMAGLESWDELTEREYINHYARRLIIVKRLLNPWGVVFIFGYPEGCAEIKSFCHRNNVLYCRRWLTWYKKRTAHKGRKVETILMMIPNAPQETLLTFGEFLKGERTKRGWTLRQVGEMANREWWHRGGNLFYENGNGGFPSLEDVIELARIYEFDLKDWPGVFQMSYPGLTDRDFINYSYPEDTDTLNESGLRSKPVGLYLDLFEPIITPTDRKTALILYGGSGNAGFAAAALGYDTTIVETDSSRCDHIRQVAPRQINKWIESLSQMNMFQREVFQQMSF